MCTAISLNGERHLFGRTLDLECSYGENVVITPQEFEFQFRHVNEESSHPALIGTAHIADGYPLYYDAMNSYGLCAAALNFPSYAVYHKPRQDSINLASFELIPYILSTCNTLDAARERLGKINITDEPFRKTLPSTPLHWIFADKNGAIAVEPLEIGLKIFDDPFGVLTNSPPFDFHATRLTEFLGLNSYPSQNSLFPDANLCQYSRGMGAMGLPGDFSSSSRFVRAVFAKAHSRLTDKNDEISRFFHVIGTVSQPNGCALTDAGVPIRTLYTSCADADTLTYYFTTYDCRRIRAVRMDQENSSGSSLAVFSMDGKEDVLYLN